MGNLCGVNSEYERRQELYRSERKWINSNPAHIIAKNNITQNLQYEGGLIIRHTNSFDRLLQNLNTQNNDWNNLILKILINYIGYWDDDMIKRTTKRTNNEISFIQNVYWMELERLTTLISHHTFNTINDPNKQFHNDQFNSMIHNLDQFTEKIKDVDIKELSVIELEHSVFVLNMMTGLLKEIIGRNDKSYQIIFDLVILCDNCFRFLIANINICLFKKYDNVIFKENIDPFYKMIQQIVWMKSLVRYKYINLKFIADQQYQQNQPNFEIYHSYESLMKKIMSSLQLNLDKYAITQIVKNRDIDSIMNDYFTVIRCIMDIYLICSVPCSYYTNIIMSKNVFDIDL